MVAAVADAAPVFDTGPLSCFARAGRWDMLGDIVAASRCTATDVVGRELADGVAHHPSLQDVLNAEWLQRAALETSDELGLFAEYSRTLDAGEASTLAWAEAHDAIALVDERAGVNVAQQRGIAVHGTLWLIAETLNSRLVNERQAITIVDDMLAAHAWFPFDRDDEFIAWARGEGLIR